MKRIIGVITLAALAVALLLPAGALAADSGSTGATAGLLAIDNANTYDGMSKSYAAGYVPTQSGSNVRVVLPLLASAAIAGDTVTVTPNLGTPGSSPFVFGNYIETVHLAQHPVNGGAANVSAYLVDLTLPLSSGRLRGSYPVAITVDYKDGAGADKQQTFTLYVTVNGKDPNATPKPSTPEPPKHQPKVIVSKYSVNPDPVQAGQGFTLAFTLQNTSDSAAVSNIKVTLKMADADVFPAQNANTLYYKSLGAGASMDVSVPMMSKQDAAETPHTVSISVEYEDERATAFTSADEVPIRVTQPLRLEFDKPNAPDSMTAGDTAPFALQVMNKGRSKVYNVTCVLKAPGLLPQSSVFLGNMEPGTAKPAQFTVFAGTLNMSSDGTTQGDASATQYGRTTGEILVTYEDETGKQNTAKVAVSTVINAPVMPTEAPVEAPQPKASQWWVSALVAAGVIAIVVLLLILNSRNRARKVGEREQQ